MNNTKQIAASLFIALLLALLSEWWGFGLFVVMAIGLTIDEVIRRRKASQELKQEYNQ
jgi:hypothetical protein